MAIRLTKFPNLVCPNPIGDCIEIEFLTDEYQVAAPTKAIATISFAPGDVQVNGNAFTMFGEQFTVDGTQQFTGNSFDGTGNNFQQGSNFILMLRANPLFNDYQISGAGTASVPYVVTITANEVGVQSPWAFDLSGMAQPPTVVENNGVGGVYRAGYHIVYELIIVKDDGSYLSAFPMQKVPPLVNASDGTILPIAVDLSNDLSAYLSTPIPSGGAPINVGEMLVSVKLRFGDIQDAAPCGVEWISQEESPIFQVINFASQQLDVEGYDPYCFRIGGDLAKFMSFRYKYNCMPSEGWQWLYFFANYKSQVGESVSIDYELEIKYYGANAFPVDTDIVPVGLSNQDGVYALPIGKGNSDIIGEQILGYEYYTVQLRVKEDRSPIPSYIYLSELIRFRIGEGCGCDYEIMFLSSRGGFDPIDCMELKSLSLSNEMTEICKEVGCGGEYDHLPNKAFERITLETKQHPKTESSIALLKDFKAAPLKLIKVKDAKGDFIWRRLLLDPGTLKIWEMESKLTITMTGRFSQDYKVLSNI